jgi:cysteine-rich repeat protein
MNDNLDGTYSYNYSVDLDGNITVSVFLYAHGGIYYEYFDNSLWTGAPSTTGTDTTINEGWTGAITTLSDTVTARYWLAIRAPTTDTVTIHVEVDDTAKIWVSDVVLINNGYGNFSETISMIDNQYYVVRIDFSENTLDAEITLKWSYTGTDGVGIVEQIIPSTYLFYPTYVASSPYQVVATCPVGYTGYDINSTEICNEIDGDGLRVGHEQCDDGNLVNGDGCNSVQVIEDDYTCDLGSSTRNDF